MIRIEIYWPPSACADLNRPLTLSCSDLIETLQGYNAIPDVHLRAAYKEMAIVSYYNTTVQDMLMHFPAGTKAYIVFDSSINKEVSV